MTRDQELYREIGQILYEAAPDESEKIVMRAKLVPQGVCSSARALFTMAGTVFLLIESRRPISRYDCPVATSASTFGATSHHLSVFW
ncbi:hypothetical protein R69658_08182 [Paraburkholderia aspalathi]|uniref:Uncharacterized protein n=1 Tax=Paraburkholderia aspalathi TaxID=1324617 RepID=A0ABM8T8T3_9BURK|nr:hypothetical protein R69658_08182 [Paraburkholderia aspalathi]